MRTSIFNEDRYLSGDQDILDIFIRSFEESQARWQLEQQIFSDTLDKYDQVIEQLAYIIKKLGFSSSLECSIALSHIINRGYVSKDMNFKDDSPNPEFEITSRYGTSIIRGVGCCRNFAAMHKEVLTLLGYDVKQLYCYERDSIFKSPQNSQANHVISLIEENGILYGIDLYNGNRLFRFKNKFDLIEVSTKSKYSLRYKPYYEITMGESNLDDIRRQLEQYEEMSHKGFITPFIYEDEIKYKVKRKVEDSHVELYQFYRDTYELKKQIVRDMVIKTFKRQ